MVELTEFTGDGAFPLRAFESTDARRTTAANDSKEVGSDVKWLCAVLE